MPFVSNWFCETHIERLLWQAQHDATHELVNTLVNVNESLPEDILWRKSPARSLTDAWGNTGLINDCTITHTRQNHRISLVCSIKTKNNLRSYNDVHEPTLCMKTRLLGCAGDVIEVGVWLWKILRYLAQSHDSPQYTMYTKQVIQGEMFGQQR